MSQYTKNAEQLKAVDACFQQAVVFRELARYIPNLRIDEVDIRPKWAGRISVFVRGCGVKFDVVPRSYGPVWHIERIAGLLLEAWINCGRPETGL